MINMQEMSPRTRSNNSTNINFCHRESHTQNYLPVSHWSSPLLQLHGIRNRQWKMHLINRNSSKDKLTKCSLWRKPQWTWAWYSSRWRCKHKNWHKSEPCSFSTVPQPFLWHQRQTRPEPTKSCALSLYIWFSTHLAAAAVWFKSFQDGLLPSLKIFHRLFIKKSRAPFLFLNYCYCTSEAVSNTWVIISNNWERENKRTHFFPTEKFLARLLMHLFLINAFIHVKGMWCLITGSEGHLAGVHQRHTERWFTLEYTVYLQSNSNARTALPGPKPNCFGNKWKRSTASTSPPAHTVKWMHNPDTRRRKTKLSVNRSESFQRVQRLC